MAWEPHLPLPARVLFRRRLHRRPAARGRKHRGRGTLHAQQVLHRLPSPDDAPRSVNLPPCPRSRGGSTSTGTGSSRAGRQGTGWGSRTRLRSSCGRNFAGASRGRGRATPPAPPSAHAAAPPLAHTDLPRLGPLQARCPTASRTCTPSTGTRGTTSSTTCTPAGSPCSPSSPRWRPAVRGSG